jgi:hypothetical protein
MASSHLKQPAPADNHTPDDGNHLSSYNLLLPDESLASSSKPPEIAWKVNACGVFAIIRILRFIVKKDRPSRFPDFPKSAQDLEELKRQWSIYMSPLDYECWPQTELTFIQSFLRTYSIYLLEGKVPDWRDLGETKSMADYESRSLRKLCDSEDIWKTKALFAVIVQCISCMAKKENCDHAHILTIESNEKEDGLVLFDQGGMAPVDKFCRVYQRYVVTDVFKVQFVNPEKVARARSRERARSRKRE